MTISKDQFIKEFKSTKSDTEKWKLILEHKPDVTLYSSSVSNNYIEFNDDSLDYLDFDNTGGADLSSIVQALGIKYQEDI